MCRKGVGLRAGGARVGELAVMGQWWAVGAQAVHRLAVWPSRAGVGGWQAFQRVAANASAGRPLKWGRLAATSRGAKVSNAIVRYLLVHPRLRPPGGANIRSTRRAQKWADQRSSVHNCMCVWVRRARLACKACVARVFPARPVSERGWPKCIAPVSGWCHGAPVNGWCHGAPQ